MKFITHVAYFLFALFLDPVIFANSFIKEYFGVFVVIVPIIVFVVQYILCKKTDKLIYKLIPFAVLTVSTIVFTCIALRVYSWEGWCWIFFAELSYVLIFICGISWSIAAISRASKV